MFLIPRAVRALVLVMLLPLLMLGGCATTHPGDPLEPMNRAVYQFNDGVDSYLISPLAKGYRAVLPNFVRTGIANFFSNINDVLVALNNLLQGKVVNALSDLGRVVVNSTIGIAGLIDVASDVGLEKHNEDFGQTLGVWGVGNGPYLVLPILGPSNLRDALGRFVDTKLDPVSYVTNMRLRNSFWGTRAISDRAGLLDTSKILETASLDPYEFLRDAYLQRRRNLIYDGSPPREKDEDANAKSTPVAKRDEAPEAAPAVPAAVAVAPVVEPESTPATEATAAAEAPAEAVPPTAVVLPDAPTGAGVSAQAVNEARVVRVWLPAMSVE